MFDVDMAVRVTGALSDQLFEKTPDRFHEQQALQKQLYSIKIRTRSIDLRLLLPDWAVIASGHDDLLRQNGFRTMQNPSSVSAESKQQQKGFLVAHSPRLVRGGLLQHERSVFRTKS
jgi:hypothetical protein